MTTIENLPYSESMLDGLALAGLVFEAYLHHLTTELDPAEKFTAEELRQAAVAKAIDRGYQLYRKKFLSDNIIRQTPISRDEFAEKVSEYIDNVQPSRR